MKVRVDTPDVKFPIRIKVPYLFLKLMTSKAILKRILKKSGYSEMIDQIDSKMINEVFNVLKEYKGTELVNVSAKDGTKVKITL
ncbi:hypothetical protein LC087_16885 [Bacillus carboniphilus]|uniref:Uncharacterized protein n=1 Tax=Bacillus carboniphilus TaxID=86663 RepID=A0ABY9JXG7_9BACI|nr:hypothetical protein [Bacillus carboniphilus]WLR42361.1 hypothetical protein LC087_16885 [Bacillus carboniphilus]